MDDTLLASLGLHAREAKIYRTVVRSGEIDPASLAKATGIKRTSAYAIARGLVEKGLLMEDSTKRPRIFSPASPKDVRHIVSEDRKRLNVREELFKELASDLSRAQSQKSYPVPQIRFLEEDKIERFLYGETSRWHKSIAGRDLTWWGFQDHTFVDQYRKWINWQWKHSPQHLEVKLLSNQSVSELRLKGQYPQRKIKFWQKANKFVSTTWVVGDYVLMINTRNHPFYLVEIHDATLANDQREVFKNLWPLV